jgi:transposase
MARILTFPDLSGNQLVELQQILRSRSTPSGLHRRTQLIWQLAAGASLVEASEFVSLHYTNAHIWMRRFLKAGIAGLTDRPKSGRPRQYGEDLTTEILKVATARPKELGLGFTTWSLPKLEQYLRSRSRLKHLNRSTIRRRLQEGGLRFRAGQTWCESKDPNFEVKKTKS